MGEQKRMICYVSEVRTRRGISQEKLAHSIGVSREAIRGIEKGIHVPNVLMAIKISEKLGVNVAELFRPADSNNNLGGLTWSVN